MRIRNIATWLPDCEGKGTLGCVVFLALLGLAVFVGVQMGPTYYAEKSFEVDVKTEISRAGANFFDDETLVKNILEIARQNEIRITRDNIKIERFAGQIFVSIEHSVPLDLYLYQRTLNFNVHASSFIGRL